MLRQAIEFSHDLDILIRATAKNAELIRTAVLEITRIDPDVSLLLTRDFQQYVDDATGTEIDVHLKLIAVPDYEAGVLSPSECCASVNEPTMIAAAAGSSQIESETVSRIFD